MADLEDANHRERQRLAALACYEVMDSPRERSFDELAALTARLCDAPIAVVNLIADGRQFFKAEVGLGVRETPLESSFCALALLEDELLVVPDLTLDARFDCNPLVTGEPHIRSYAGALLKTDRGVPIGTLCVLDHRPRTFTDLQQETLLVLARQVMAQLDLRRTAKDRDRRFDDLRASEERLRLVLDSAQDYAIVTTDVDRRITSWSAGAEAAFEWSGQEATGRLFDELFVPEDRAAGVPEREVAQAAAEGRAPDVRWHLRADGSRVFMNGSTHPIRDRDGRNVGFLKIARNETRERTQADELARTRVDLVESEARYRTLFESIDAGFCVIEVAPAAADRPADYRVVEANPAFYRQSGLAADILGRWMRAAVPGRDGHLYDTYDRVARTGEPARFEEGSSALGRWFDVYAFRTGAADELRVAILFNDISARRRIEEALQQLNETLEDQVAERTAERDRMWDTSPDLMLVIGFDGVFRRVNPAWTAVLGYTRDELVGHHVNEFVLQQDREQTVAAYEAAGEGLRPRLENRYRHKDGSIRWISWVAAPAGDLTYATGRDVTSEREREAELAHAHDQLRQAQKMEAVGQLTGGLAHDFNNLLTGIMGNLELLQMRVARGRLDDLDRLILAAQGAGRRAASLTQRLLAFSRRQTLDPKPTDVNRLIAGMEDLLRRTVGPATVIEVVGAAGLWPANIDAGQLENALLNLSINARDAMPDGGRLTIETANKWLDDRAARDRDLPPGQYLSVCVTDTGIGMDAATIERAFEPFFTTKPMGEGTGLGLSMIYGFARQSNGQVRIYSEVGSGTTICVYLPRHMGEAPSTDEEDVVASATAAGGQAVLVVDDEVTIRHLIDEVLGDVGYTITGVADGAAGLKVLQSRARIDLLITDVGLPGGMNGRQVADAARTLRPGLKVLFITGYAENAAVGNGHLEPGMALLTKPFTMDALTTKVADMMKGN